MSTLLIYTNWLLRKHMRTAIIWIAAFTLYVAMIVSIYPTFSNAGMLDVVKNYPEPFKKMFNVDLMASLPGFLSVEIFTFLPLVLAFFPITTLAGAIAGEEERGSMDIYLAQPISRRHIVLANVISTAIWCIVMLTVACVANRVLAQVRGMELGFRQALEGFLGVFPVIFVFGLIALAVGSFARTKGAATGAAFVTMFMLYLANAIGKLVPDYESIRTISPFRWYDDPIINGINWTGVLILLTACLVLLLTAIVVFDRRDVYT